MSHIFLALGKLTPIISVEKIYEADGDFVLKIISTNAKYVMKAKKSENADFVVESENMEIARSVLGDLVPKVYHVDKKVLVMEWKEGIHIDSPDYKCIRDKLKSIKSDIIISNDPRLLTEKTFHGSSQDWMKHRVNNINKILKYKGFTKSFPLYEFEEEEVFFQHNNLHPENILVDPVNHKIVAVLDWAISGFYPAHFEVSKMNFRKINHNLEQVENIYQTVESRLLTANVLKYNFSQNDILNSLHKDFFSEL